MRRNIHCVHILHDFIAFNILDTVHILYFSNKLVANASIADCPNAQLLRERMGYRVLRARWAGKGSKQYPVTLHVVGHDDIGIVSNITSILNKEKNVMMCGLSIQTSEDGLFSGQLTVMIDDQNQLTQLMKKLSTVKGVKSVTR